VTAGDISVDALLADAAEECRRKLDEDSFARVLTRLGPYGRPERAYQLLSQGAVHPGGAELAGLCASIPAEAGQNTVERALLVLASLHAIARVPSLPVSDSVKGLFVEEFRFFANPPAAWTARFRADDVRYGEMARIATLRRYPAGQFHWEIAGLPRSWAVKARKPWRVLAYVLKQMGGFAPLWELHLNDRRKYRRLLLEDEANISYCRAARSLEKQPGVRGLMTASWLYSQSTAQVTPHLAWLRQTVQDGGALLAELGPASADAGFLTGSKERRKLYEQGQYRPNVTCVLWPRRRLIDWANRHPEFDL